MCGMPAKIDGNVASLGFVSWVDQRLSVNDRGERGEIGWDSTAPSPQQKCVPHFETENILKQIHGYCSLVPNTISSLISII